jgi:DNA-binding MarR family transcriptional regulator
VKQTLGTQLRHLIDLLDGAVSAAYKDAGLVYRPRYTPIMRALIDHDSLTIGRVAEIAGITQPAATQTVALMIKQGILSAKFGREDGRQKLIRLTTKGRELLPKLTLCWQATAMAANSLDAELHFPLSQMLENAINALTRKSYGTRISEARATLVTDANKAKRPTPALELKRSPEEPHPKRIQR